MKLYINVNKQSLVGYKNINLATDTIDLQNLNNICEQAEATEIILDNVLEYINFNQIKDFVTKISTRMRMGGKIIVVSSSAPMILDAFNNGLIGYADLNNIMYGSGPIKKSSTFDLHTIENILKELNLNIVSTELNNYTFILIAKRTN